MSNIEDAKTYIINMVTTNWDKTNAPLILSNLGEAFEREHTQLYSSIIRPLRLHHFIATFVPEVRAVRHTVLKNTIGLMPASVPLPPHTDDVFTGPPPPARTVHFDRGFWNAFSVPIHDSAARRFVELDSTNNTFSVREVAADFDAAAGFYEIQPSIILGSDVPRGPPGQQCP